MFFYAYPDGKTFIFGDIYKDGVFLSKVALERIQEKSFKDFQSEIEKNCCIFLQTRGCYQVYLYDY